MDRTRSPSHERTHRHDDRRDLSRTREDERRPRTTALHDSRRRRSSRSRSPPPTSSRFSNPHHRRNSVSRSRSPKRHRSASRSRSRERESHRDRHKDKRKRGRSRSRSRSSASSISSDHKSRRHKKDKHRRRSSRSRERKERKKERKEKKKKHGPSHTLQWGKYGLISEIDMFTKGQEFHTWLVEERKINPETMSKDQNKKEFARFMEDYNTATLPHEKYYNMESYQRRMDALRSGEFVPPPEDSYDPAADILAHQSKHKKQAVETESYLSKEQLLELRKVQHERIEVAKMKLLGMDVKLNMGVRMDGTMFDG